ncbi:MAG: sensor histidine kinase [bacterium]
MNRNGHSDGHSDGYPTVLFVFLVILSALSILGERPPESVGELLDRTGPALLLLAVHALLHLRGLRGRSILYHAVQTLLVALIGMVTKSVSPVITLTAWMCGETVAAEPARRIRLLGTAWHGLVGMVLILAVAGLQGAVQWIGAAVPTVAFVIVVTLLYARESRARASAQELARELADANRRIALYAAEAAARSRDDERRRMARDLHDTLAQGLTGITLQIQAAQAYLDDGRSGDAGAVLDTSLDQARRTLADARQAIYDLRKADATAPNGEPLSEVLRAVSRDLARRYGRPVRFTSRLAGYDEAQLPGAVVSEVTTILREAVHNAMRHAACDGVRMTLTRDDEALRLEVCDSGCGFDPDQVAANGHYGLRGMRERAEGIGARLSVAAAPGSGTTVTLAIPRAFLSGRSESADE